MRALIGSSGLVRRRVAPWNCVRRRGRREISIFGYAGNSGARSIQAMWRCDGVRSGSHRLLSIMETGMSDTQKTTQDVRRLTTDEIDAVAGAGIFDNTGCIRISPWLPMPPYNP